jgi:Serine endopeptidase inhibitors
MPPIKIDDLAPTPFFAHFLEGQYAELTAEQMKNLRGGTTVVTMAAPSDSDQAEVKPSPFPLFDHNQFPWNVVAPAVPGPAGPCGPSELTAL